MRRRKQDDIDREMGIMAENILHTSLLPGITNKQIEDMSARTHPQKHYTAVHWNEAPVTPGVQKHIASIQTHPAERTFRAAIAAGKRKGLPDKVTRRIAMEAAKRESPCYWPVEPHLDKTKQQRIMSEYDRKFRPRPHIDVEEEDVYVDSDSWRKRGRKERAFVVELDEMAGLPPKK